MDNTYWNRSGKYQELADQLRERVPAMGPVEHPYKNKALERFRNASNCYYDLYNNGLMNRAKQFARIFSVRSTRFRSVINGFLPRLYELTESKMDEIVLEAAKEQGLLN